MSNFEAGYRAAIDAAIEAANGIAPELLKGMSERYVSIYCTARVDAADAIRDLMNLAGVAEQSGPGAPETSVRCGAPAAPLVWMNSEQLEAYRSGKRDGIAWASPEKTDFYNVALSAHIHEEVR